MKKLYTLLLCSIGLSTIIPINCNAQLIVNADAVVASSSDFVQANVLVDADPSNYAYLSASLGVLSTSFLTVSFPQSGHAGDIVTFTIQGTGGLLSAGLLNNTTIRLYDDNNVNVATASGGTILNLNLALAGPNIYTVRFVTDATASYTIKKATIEFNNVLSVQLLDQLRVYSAFLQTPCTSVYATSVNSSATTGLLGFISNPTNAVNGDPTSFATIGAGVLGNAFIDLAFSVKGTAGEFVGFTIGQSATLLSLTLLQNISIDAYNSSGSIVSTKNNFGLADLRLLDGSTDKYIIGFVTQAGSYDIARLRITLGGINVLTSLNIYNAMHFKLVPNAVSITASGTSFCDGSTVSLTANAPSLSNITWSNGATSNPLTLSNSATVSFTATDAEGCISTSLPIAITKLALPTISISNGATASFCAGGSIKLTATPSTGATLLWSTGASTNDITVSTGGTYTVTATGTNLCQSLAGSILVTQLALPTVSITNGGTAAFCSNKNVTLSATPSAGASILWSTGATTNNITVNSAATYTVTATDLNLCSSVPASVIVSSLTAPTISITNGPAASFCSNKNVTLSATPSAGATVLWSTGATTNSISVNSAATYTVTATAANLCSSDAASVTVSSLTAPTVSISNGPTANFCSNKNVTLSATPSAGATVLWSTGATTNSITVNSAATYTVTATAANLCSSDPASVAVSSLTVPTVSISNGPTASFCSNKNVTLSATPSAGATVLWSTGATTNSISVNNAATYSVTATAANLCSSDAASVTVSSLTIPTVSISNGPTASFCSNKNVTLSATPSAGATILWSTGATTNSIIVNSAATYTVTATAANLCSSDPASVTVSSLTIPTVTITNGSTASFCSNKDVSLMAVPSVGATVLWSTGATTDGITVNSAATYTVTATDANLCSSAPSSITVTALTIPTVSITNGPAASFCSNKNVVLSATPSAGATVLWSTGATTNSITVNNAATYTVTATDANLCSSAPSSIAVTSLAIPTVSITNGSAASFCSNKNVVLSAVPSAGATVLWNTGASTNDITVNTAETYTVTATDVNLCSSAPASVVVTSIAIPTVSITNGATASFCSDLSVTLSAAASAGATVLWNTGATTNNISVTAAATYTVTATDVNLCASAPATIIVSSLPVPTISISASGATNICAQDNVTLSATPSSDATVLWSTGATTTDITVNTAGDFSATAISNNGCRTASTVIPITLKASPVVTSTINQITCNGANNGSILLAPVGSAASYQYSWNTGSTNATINQLAPATYKVDIEDNVSMCSIHLEYVVNEPQVLSLTGVTTKETCADSDGSITFEVSGGTLPYTYNLPLIKNNSISGLKAGTYSVTVTDKNMCQTNQSYVIVKFDCSTALNIHNVVTPNNDGLNDALVIEGIEKFPHCSLEIFDKWGDVVYDKKDYDNTWDGRNKNNSGPLPAGTYYYLLKLNTSDAPNGKSEYTGFVMIQ